MSAPQRLPISDVRLPPPIPKPAKIIYVGMNFHKPYPVDGTPLPDPGNVILFGHERQTIVGHEAALEIPPGPAAESFNYEAERAQVIRPRRSVYSA